MKKLFLLMAAVSVLSFGSVARADDDENETLPTQADAIWYCQATSYVTGAWYYWYSYNAYYARNQALGACVAQNGYTCTVNCTFGY